MSGRWHPDTVERGIKPAGSGRCARAASPPCRCAEPGRCAPAFGLRPHVCRSAGVGRFAPWPLRGACPYRAPPSAAREGGAPRRGAYGAFGAPRRIAPRRGAFGAFGYGSLFDSVSKKLRMRMRLKWGVIIEFRIRNFPPLPGGHVWPCHISIELHLGQQCWGVFQFKSKLSIKV